MIPVSRHCEELQRSSGRGDEAISFLKWGMLQYYEEIASSRLLHKSSAAPRNDGLLSNVFWLIGNVPENNHYFEWQVIFVQLFFEVMENYPVVMLNIPGQLIRAIKDASFA
ncbi:hypothetical protein [Chitinophaga sp. YIM B06452]|uniref:hypothetical protein n=1 Tax=Chitinophaga sp. YIM B06452 TaxID=3082158 RepID=UPI0031FE6DB2